MSDDSAWQPVQEKGRSNPGAFVASPFVRLARTHSLLVAGDALIALALAGSLFFSIDPSDARWRVGLYLLLTMAPFAIVAPLIGPTLDRIMGGRRWMIVLSGGLRSAIALLMIVNLDSLLLFPLAFGQLVLGKGYHVAKSATVPTTVDTDDELVAANSKLSLLSGLAGAAAMVPGGLFMLIGGSQWVCGLAAATFAVATVVAFRLEPSVVATEPPDAEEKAELRGHGILLAASAMGFMRGLVGFLTFLIAFTLRGTYERPYVEDFGSYTGAGTRDLLGVPVTEVSTGAPTWHFGVAVAMAGLGAPLGSLIAPRLRKVVAEERILVGALITVVICGLIAGLYGGLFGAALVSFSVSICAATGKVAFDSILQRDAPDANRGRSFARFETRFQLIWVVGAAIPVVIPIPGPFGYLMISACAGFAAGSYLVGRKFLLIHGRMKPRRTDEVATRIKSEAKVRARKVRETATLKLRPGGIGPKGEPLPPEVIEPDDSPASAVEAEPSNEPPRR